MMRNQVPQAAAVQPVLVLLHRPEGYEDVHPDLILQDANINPAFEPEVVAAPAAIPEVLERARLALERASALLGSEDPQTTGIYSANAEIRSVLADINEAVKNGGQK